MRQPPYLPVNQALDQALRDSSAPVVGSVVLSRARDTRVCETLFLGQSEIDISAPAGR